MRGGGAGRVSLLLRVGSRLPPRAMLVLPLGTKVPPRPGAMASGALAEGTGQVVLVNRGLNLTSGSPQVQTAATC